MQDEFFFGTVKECNAAFGCVAVASIAFGRPNALVKGQSPLIPPSCFERRSAVIEKTYHQIYGPF